MNRLTSLRLAGTAIAVAALSACGTPMPSSNPMTFFITSANPGKGGDLGGLAGADAYCQKLATDVGAGGRTWRAYLSTSTADGVPLINARDRIGKGPWANAQGVVVANSVAELHGENNLNKQTALTEKGEVVNGRGDTPNTHDILTGSNPDGTAAALTCGNWTSSTVGSAIVGHHDRQGLNTSPPMLSWSTSHPTRGCTIPDFNATGGSGLFYCFAVN